MELDLGFLFHVFPSPLVCYIYPRDVHILISVIPEWVSNKLLHSFYVVFNFYFLWLSWHNVSVLLYIFVASFLVYHFLSFNLYFISCTVQR